MIAAVGREETIDERDATLSSPLPFLAGENDDATRCSLSFLPRLTADADFLVEKRASRRFQTEAP